MRKVLLAAIAAATALSMAPASANTFEESGTILVANPVSRLFGGVSEIGSPCNGSPPEAPEVPPGTFQGVDGFWIELPADSGGMTATLTAAAPNDVDGWFYDEGCNLMPSPYPLATTNPIPNGNEQGVIPEGAAWVAVDLYTGANATFTFTIL